MTPELTQRLLRHPYLDRLRQKSVVDRAAYAQLCDDLRALAGEWRDATEIDRAAAHALYRLAWLARAEAAALRERGRPEADAAEAAAAELDALILGECLGGPGSLPTEPERPRARRPRLPAWHRLAVFTDCFRFSLHDARADPAAFEWPPGEHARLVAAAPGLLVVSTTRSGLVPVDVFVSRAAGPPDEAVGLWDHVVEAGLDASSGRLRLTSPADPGDDARTLAVPPGTYSARVSLRGRVPASRVTWTNGDDQARFDLWPAAPRPLRVVKQWPGAFPRRPKSWPLPPLSRSR